MNRRVIVVHNITPRKFYTVLQTITLENGKPVAATRLEVENNGGY